MSLALSGGRRTAKSPLQGGPPDRPTARVIVSSEGRGVHEWARDAPVPRTCGRAARSEEAMCSGPAPARIGSVMPTGCRDEFVIQRRLLSRSSLGIPVLGCASRAMQDDYQFG